MNKMKKSTIGIDLNTIYTKSFPDIIVLAKPPIETLPPTTGSTKSKPLRLEA